MDPARGPQLPRIGVNVSAGTALASSGLVYFSNANSISWGVDSAGVLTALPQAGGILSISAGTTLISSGTAVFSNSNGLSFGLNGSTITGQLNQVSYFDNLNQGVDGRWDGGGGPFGPMVFQRASMMRKLDATRADFILNLRADLLQNGNSMTLALGVYTMNGTTASLASSAQVTISWTNTNSSSLSGTQWRTIALGTMAFTPGEYLLASNIIPSTTNLTLGQLVNAPGQTKFGPPGGSGFFQFGSYRAGSTLSFPATVAASNVNGADDGGGFTISGVFLPYARLAGTF